MLGSQHIEAIGNEVYDGECLKLINEYFYGVRIYPGQDPTHGNDNKIKEIANSFN